MKIFYSLGLVLLVVFNTQAGPVLNERPIIGILAQETDPDKPEPGDTYIPSDYFQYVEMAGARAMPVFVKRSNDYYEKVFQSINGLLLPGGGVNILTSEYAKAAQVFFKLASEANRRNDYFPLWGTCQGFELMTALVTGQNLLSKYDAFDLALPLDITGGAEMSRLMGNMPADVYKYLRFENTTMNFHHYGLSPTTYQKTQELSTFYKVLSTNVDKNGKDFISTMEAYDFPYYAVQWHPEKANFLWNEKFHINHYYPAIRVSQYMANFFVQEARKSTHHFQNKTVEINALIENYRPVYVKDTTFEEMYYFNYTAPDPWNI